MLIEERDQEGARCNLIAKLRTRSPQWKLKRGQEGFVEGWNGEGREETIDGKSWLCTAAEKMCTLTCVRCGEDTEFVHRIIEHRGEERKERRVYDVFVTDLELGASEKENEV